MKPNDSISAQLIELLINKDIKRSKSLNDQKKSIINSISYIWESLEEINIQTNLELLNEDSTNSDNSTTSWLALANCLNLILILEDRLKFEITFSTLYSDSKKIQKEKSNIRKYISNFNK